MINDQEYITTELKKTLEKMIILSSTRLNNLVAMVIGIIISQSVILSKISQELKDSYSSGTEESKIKRLQMFLGNKAINAERIYEFFAYRLLQNYKNHSKKMYIIFDHTTIIDKYLSKVDDIFWEEHPTKPDRPETWKDYKIDAYIQDGDTITLGDKTIYVYGTPGHTPGGLSYAFPVKENGEIHMAALWGGTTPPWTKNEVEQYIKSLDYFISEAMRKKADVALSNHTAVDNGLERIMYSKTRMDYMPNIYIIGQDGFQNYCQVFRTLSYEMLENLL